MMNLSESGFNFLADVEGLKLKPYLDSRGVPTIGIGCTFYEDGTKVTMNDPAITSERAYELAKNVLKSFEEAVNKSVKVELTQNQFDALVSFTYNEGIHAFENSTMLKLINQSDFTGAAAQFNSWERAGSDAHILHNRREKEKSLFLQQG